MELVNRPSVTWDEDNLHYDCDGCGWTGSSLLEHDVVVTACELNKLLLEVETLRNSLEALAENTNISADAMRAFAREMLQGQHVPPTPDVVEENGANPVPPGVVIHDPAACAGTACAWHTPSEHHMVHWPLNLRMDYRPVLTERICPHGIGHPDPDSIAWMLRVHGVDVATGSEIHGCDGCCHSNQGAPDQEDLPD